MMTYVIIDADTNPKCYEKMAKRSTSLLKVLGVASHHYNGPQEVYEHALLTRPPFQVKEYTKLKMAVAAQMFADRCMDEDEIVFVSKGNYVSSIGLIIHGMHPKIKVRVFDNWEDLKKHIEK